MFFKKWRKRRAFDSHLKAFVATWDVARAIDYSLENEPNRSYSDYEWIVYWAAFYGAADSIGQAFRLNEQETQLGIERFLTPYSNAEELVVKITVASTMDELEEMVTAAGDGMYQILAKEADVTTTMMKMYEVFKRLTASNSA